MATLEDCLPCKLHAPLVAKWDPLPCAMKCEILHQRDCKDKKKTPRANVLSLSFAFAMAAKVGSWTPRVPISASPSPSQPQLAMPNNIGVPRESSSEVNEESFTSYSE